MTRLETRILGAIRESGPLRFSEVADAVGDRRVRRTYLEDALVDSALDKLVIYRSIERHADGLYRIAEGKN